MRASKRPARLGQVASKPRLSIKWITRLFCFVGGAHADEKTQKCICENFKALDCNVRGHGLYSGKNWALSRS